MKFSAPVKKIFFFVFGICCLCVAFWYFFIHRLYSLPLSRKVRLSDDRTYVDGKFDILACKINNIIVTVRYLIPWDDVQGKPCSSASQIVFYAPCNGEARKIRKSLPLWVKEFAAQHKASVFSLTIDVEESNMLSKEFYYIHHEAGWHDIVFSVKSHLETEFNLENRKMIATGESSGGSWCQQLVARYPEKFCKAAWCGGRIYIPFSPQAKNIPMLSLNIKGCPGEIISRNLTKDFTRHGGNLLHVVIASYINRKGQQEHHAANSTCYSLLFYFLTHDNVDFNQFIKRFSDVSISY